MSGSSKDDAHIDPGVTENEAKVGLSLRVYAWLNMPLRSSWCLIGWIVASIIFVRLVMELGGPTQGDVSVSAYSTWALAHGHLSCFYSPPSKYPFPPFASPYTMVGPMYPLIAGAVLGVGHALRNAPFPTTAQLGSGCSHALVAMYHWSLSYSIIEPTINVGYLMWLPLLIGAILLLRAGGRGHTRWEPLTLIGIAVLPPVVECLLTYFHPQDLLALGLALCTLAFAIRGKWAWAGALLGLAFLSNQYVLLVAAPLIVVMPSRARARFGAAALAAVVVIVAPLAIVTSGRAIKWSILGSGYAPPPKFAYGGTIMRNIPLSPHELLLCARILPIVCALVLAWWARRRLGDAVLHAVPLLSLVATSLAFRLVFEVSLWGYYFAACAVIIIINDVISGRIRGRVIAWLALFTLALNPIPWGFATNGRSWGLAAREAMPNVFFIVALILIISDVIRDRVRWYLLAWFVLVGLTLVKNPLSHAALRTAMPSWFWQVVLVPITIALAVSPLIDAVRTTKSTAPSNDTVPDSLEA